MEIELQPADFNDKPILRNLFELYQYDFSEYENSDVDDHGLFGYRYLDHYWTDPGRHAFLIRIDGKLAGFALVRELHEGHSTPTYSIAEFFVMRKYRRKGIGREAACRLFDQFPGRWRVAEEINNLPSQSFWHNIIEAYTQGNYEEMRLDNDEWRGLVQVFEIGGRAGGFE